MKTKLYDWKVDEVLQTAEDRALYIQTAIDTNDSAYLAKALGNVSRIEGEKRIARIGTANSLVKPSTIFRLCSVLLCSKNSSSRKFIRQNLFAAGLVVFDSHNPAELQIYIAASMARNVRLPAQPFFWCAGKKQLINLLISWCRIIILQYTIAKT